MGFYLFVADCAVSYSFAGRWYSLSGRPMYPTGVAVDSNGNVFVTDLNNHSVHKFDSEGKLAAKWGTRGCGDGQFNEPNCVAVDSKGNVYVVDSGNHRIQQFDSDGKFLGKWGSQGSGEGEFEEPSGAAVDSTGNVYVADLYNHRVQKFDSQAKFLMKFGKKGRGDGELACPHDVAVDSAGNVYVADFGSDRIQKFDSHGNFRLKWGSRGTGDGQFRDPNCVTVDSEGNVFVADMGNSRIQKFDSQGQFLRKWGRKGSGEGEFDWPLYVAVDSGGTVFVADGHNTRIQKFRPIGQKKTGERKRLTIENIVLLKELGIGDDTILEKITSSGTMLSAEEIEQLRKAGLNEAFIGKLPKAKEKKKPKLTADNVVLLKEIGIDENKILAKVTESGSAFTAEELKQFEKAGFSGAFMAKLSPKEEEEPEKEKEEEKEEEEEKPIKKGLAGSWQFKASGAEIKLTLAQDGTLRWHLKSGSTTENLKGTWKKVDDATIEIKQENNPLRSRIPCKLIDAETLEMALRGATLRFKRIEE